MRIGLRLATLLMKYGNRHSRFCGHDCNTPSFIQPHNDQPSIATKRAFDDGPSFFQRFEGTLSPHDFSSKDLLDIGSGCGGRTAYYQRYGNPRSIVGLDISELRAGIARRSIEQLCADNRIHFTVGVGEQLPFRDESFNGIISYDVFEHVKDLDCVLEECYRVLRPGGRLYSLFPPYYGPRAHHLDFITTLPFLHHVFAPSVLVEAANRILQEQPSLRDIPLPKPGLSYLGREVLPRLNGTTERDFRRIVGRLPFEVEQLKLVPFGSGPGGLGRRAVRFFCGAMLRLPVPFTRDVFASTIRCVLKKRETKRIRL
jgi:SAM-dependent methyltransferase